jgi:Predicted Na+-dependent transporter
MHLELSLGDNLMYILEKISEFVGKWMAVVVLAIAALSLFVPKSTLWIELSWVNYLLMVVMFGMGLTLKLTDFKLVFTRPKELPSGVLRSSS